MRKYSKEIMPIIILFLVCAAVSFVLALTNFFTKVEIKNQNDQATMLSRQKVLSVANEFEEKNYNGINYYIGLNEGKIVGYVFVNKAKGYGGDIEVMVGITPDKNVSGVNILSQNETPGLGANATKDSFKNQFLKSISNDGFNVVKSKPKNNNEIEALTGATISSKAVTLAVNKAIGLFNKINPEVN